MSAWNLGVELNCDLLETMAEQVTGLSPEVYSTPNELVGSVGVGSHVRHCMDFYGAFLAGAAQGRVDYDARTRQLELEQDPSEAGKVLAQLPPRLRALAPLEAMVVRLDAVDDDPVHWSPTSGVRELRFLAAHTVHHAAMIAMLLRLAGVEIPTDFGIAPSTLLHWKDAQARA